MAWRLVGASSAVVDASVLLYPDAPPSFTALTRYRYVVPALRPVFCQLVAPGPVVCIRWKFEHDDPVQRSISKPVSFVEFRVHVRLICDVETVEACKFVGAAGVDCWVVAVAVFV